MATVRQKLKILGALGPDAGKALAFEMLPSALRGRTAAHGKTQSTKRVTFDIAILIAELGSVMANSNAIIESTKLLSDRASAKTDSLTKDSAREQLIEELATAITILDAIAESHAKAKTDSAATITTSDGIAELIPTLPARPIPMARHGLCRYY